MHPIIKIHSSCGYSSSSSSSSSSRRTTMTTSPPPIQTNRVQTVQSLQVDDNKKDDTQPFIARASTYPRRRPSTLRSPLLRQRSLTRNISHAASETYLVTGLAFKLLTFLGVGYRWIWRVLSLCFYAMLLMPGFLQVAYYYFFSSQVRRSIVYGDQPRNRFDLYLPKNSDGPKPVLAFVTGGAWIIGYKAWGSLLGKQLAERDIIVACFDYRNFPQGTITDMVEDVLQGISFVCNNIVDYGGDPNRIYLMGQSAGAHISSCALLEQAVKESEGRSVSWSVSQIKAYFGLSGGYNIPSLVEHFHGRGLYRSVFLSIMEGEKSLQHFSPEIRIQDPRICNAVAMLPQIILFHGTSDYSIPSDASRAFADALQRVGAKAELILYSGKTHTDLFLHDPLRGGKDELFDYVVAFIHAGDKEALAKDAVAPPRPRLLPEFLLQLARQVSPF
ncbi:isoprenylcysteine alpha-carbonyl methylesterase ICME-like [Rhododendron vialii]|uniref:isoprenylcysteine alpha-carbonyl methylesterase ICME-like n=1 Tax=Rhododendron vialii TaxID=182163 RepID=UPI00265FA0A3|nr:isoprenylcysteine alpha-carbonyl methylesterase ICME-like [Rhododendron vialii]